MDLKDRVVGLVGRHLPTYLQEGEVLAEECEDSALRGYHPKTGTLVYHHEEKGEWVVLSPGIPRTSVFNEAGELTHRTEERYLSDDAWNDWYQSFREIGCAFA